MPILGQTNSNKILKSMNCCFLAWLTNERRSAYFHTGHRSSPSRISDTLQAGSEAVNVVIIIKLCENFDKNMSCENIKKNILSLLLNQERVCKMIQVVHAFYKFFLLKNFFLFRSLAIWLILKDFSNNIFSSSSYSSFSVFQYHLIISLCFKRFPRKK